MIETYTYDIATQTANGAVSEASLLNAIRTSAITVALDSVGVSGGSLSVVMKASLDATDKAILDAIVAAHDGVRPAKAAPPVTSDGAPIVKLDAPSERDKKPVVVISPATEGWLTWVTGAGDKIPPDPGTTGRGEGPRIKIAFDGTEPQGTEKSIDIVFSEPIEVHDGQVSWSQVASFGFDDRFSLSAIIQATPSTPNAGGTGNANKIEISPGTGMHVYVPAPGNGAWDIDMAVANPVPDKTKSAFWDVNYESGEVSASSSPGAAEWNLFDFDAPPISLIKSVGMGNPMGIFDIDVYKTEYIHPSWIVRFSVTKETPAACQIGGWLFTFREYTT